MIQENRNARGVAKAVVEIDLERGVWHVRSAPGEMVKLDGGTGRWRAKGLEFDAEPLGG